MRSISLILISCFCAATALADSFGPERPLTAVQTGQELPSVSLTTNGLVGLWNSGGTVAGRAPWGQQIAPSAVLALDPVPHRDGSLASIGDESLATWVENDWLYGLRIDANGKAIGQPTLLQQVDSRHTMRSASGASSSEYLVVWPQSSRILGTTLDAQGNTVKWLQGLVDGPFSMSVEKVSVASNGTDFLVVWEASSEEPWFSPCVIGCHSTDREVRAIVVGADGVSRRETEVQLATNAAMPEVVWTGSDYLVVWTNLPDGGLAGRRLSSAGALTGPVQTFTTDHDWSPEIASEAAGTDVAFARVRSDGQTELRALRIRPDGTITSLTPTPLMLGTTARQFSMAANGSRVALVYTASGYLNLRVLEAGSGPTRLRAARH